MNPFDRDLGAAQAGPGLDWAAFLDAARRRPLWVAAGAALGLAAALGFLAKSEPVYRAEATLMLEKSEHSDGVLGDLARLTAAPAAAAEIAVLQSRTLAEATVAEPSTGSLPRFETATEQPQLALTTRVEDHGLKPLAGLLARFTGHLEPEGRLNAALKPLDASAVESLELKFLDQHTILVSSGNLADAWQELNFTPGLPLEVLGNLLVLEPSGEVIGKRFTILRQTEADAARRLMGKTRVVETQRNSGVLAVSVSDSDPLRAAAAANAICANYFRQVVSKGRERASTTVEFIESQLALQQEALRTAEAAVVELRRAHPDLIDLPSAAAAIAGDLSELELSRMRLEVEQKALEEAAALFAERRFEALSRLGEQLSDPLSQSLIEQLSTLSMQRLTLGVSADQPARLALQNRVDSLASTADELGLQIAALGSLVARLKSGDFSATALLSESPESGVAADPLSLSYLNRLSESSSELSRLEREITPLHPDYQSASAALDELEAKFLLHLEARLEGLEALHQGRLQLVAQAQIGLEAAPEASLLALEQALTQVEARTASHLNERSGALKRHIEDLKEFSQALEQRLETLPEVERELAGPLRQLETHKELTGFLLRSLQEAEIKRAASLPAATFIDPASPPALRYAPRVGLSLVFGTALGLCAGLALAFLRERLRGALHSDKALEQVTGLPILATIPDFRHGRSKVRGAPKEFIAMRDAPHGPVAEAYRSLRANLRFASGERDLPRTLAVTSCAPSEGKSTTNVDLAWAFAAGGRKVLLVDADMRRPSVHRYLGKPLGAGLAEALSTPADWRQLVQSTSNPDLSVLMAGHLKGGAGEALTGPRAGELIEEWKATYDLVVFDLPPALVVADVEAFAYSLEAIVLLYRAGGLPAAAVETACVRLRQSGAKLVGAVMNAFRHERRGSGYYGAYGGYGQSEYYLKAKEETARVAG
jgi:capsular exopolysaccharide synthesis family protein